jgi:threonylcarbamoyladenosine tRNA methylthiotransferase MtaB
MRIFFDTVGCRLNQAEIEEMAANLRHAGHEIVGKIDLADAVIVNSCAVTAAASSDSRQKVRQAYQKGIDNIILTGCWATLYPKQASALQGVTSVVDNLSKMNIPAQLIDLSDDLIDKEPIARKPIPGTHHRTRAFIKVQDGCDNFCTYCVTRLARGKSQSIPKEQIILHINEATAGGSREVVLTGVNLGSWGKDLDQRQKLSDLIRYLLNNSEIERIRLSSLEPWDIDSSFFDLWQDSRLCTHLHLPLQSGSMSELKRMTRNTTPEKFKELIDTARTKINNLAVTTDIIVGFPGETEKEFEESLNFIDQMKFSGGHVFKYSRREGTSAEKLPMQINGSIAQERASQIRELLSRHESDYLSSQLSKTVDVLWEAKGKRIYDRWELEGYSENYLRVRATANENRWNKIDHVKVESFDRDFLMGTIIEPGS